MKNTRKEPKQIRLATKRTLFFGFILFFGFTNVFAQSKKITGTVIDESGESLIGVTLMLQGSKQGTITDMSGNFSIDANIGDVIRFSYIGMKDKSVTIDENASVLNITMTADGNMLDEAVVIGYGTAKKRDLTGSIVSVKGDDLKTTPSQSAVSGLQGKVAGLSVSNTGTAGSAPQVRLRGIGSMNNAGVSYLVDGVLIGDINFLNPSDIASMEVLKDASSLSIFGLRGANGIIVVTTKKAQVGKTTVNVDAYTGFQKLMPYDKLKLTDGNQFTELLNERLYYTSLDYGENYEPFVPQVQGAGTDWIDEVTRNGIISNVSVSVSSATEKNNSFFSLSYFTQDGIVYDDNYQRYTIRFNDDYKVFNWWKIGGTAALSYDKKNNNSFRGYGAIMQNAVWAMPTYKPYNDDGSFMMPDRTVQSNIGNPVAWMKYGTHDDHTKTYRLSGNLFTEFTLFDKVVYRSAGYLDARVAQGKTYREAFKLDGMQQQLRSNLSRSSAETIVAQTENYLTYEDTFNKDHQFKAMAGVTTMYNGSENFSAARDTIGRYDRVSEYDQMLNQGTIGSMSNGDGKSEYSQVAVISRINYSYKSKYMLSATFRAEASSKFPDANKWGYFPSVGIAWNMSEENFMAGTSSWLDFLKLKASYGELANDAPIGAYAQYDYVNWNKYAVFGNGLTQYPTLPGVYADPRLTWERMKGTDVGIEVIMLNSRLGFDIGWFNRLSSDFLVTPAVTPGTIVYSPTNGGSMRNRGIEIAVNWSDKIGEFKYGVNANFSYIKNKVLGVGIDDKPTYNEPCRTSVGDVIGYFYGLKIDGVFQNQEEIDAYVYTDADGNTTKIQPDAKPGDFKFVNLSDDEKIDESDYTNIGSYFAPYSFGLNLTGSYKGFDMSVDFAGVAGNKIYNQSKYPGGDTPRNFIEGWTERWHGEGTSNTYPILSLARPDNFKPSEFYLENGSYLRLRNIQFGYTLSSKLISKIKLTRCRVYVNAQNLVTMTQYSGTTPEISSGILRQGVDDGTIYPLPATFTFGVNLSF